MGKIRVYDIRHYSVYDFRFKTESVKDKLYSKIKFFEELPQGWDFGYGIAVSTNVSKKAKQIFDEINTHLSFGRDEFKYDVTPIGDGGMVLIVYLNVDFVHIIINPDLSIDLRWEEGYGLDYKIIKEEETVGNKSILFILKTIFINSCSWSERYTSLNTMRLEEDSNPIHSGKLTAVYPSLRQNVQYKPAKQFATT